MIVVPKGVNILKYLQETNQPVTAACNGTGKCGKCKIKILSPKTNPTKIEFNLLTDSEIKNNVRLACMHHTASETKIELFNQNNNMQITSNIMNLSLNESYIRKSNDTIYRFDTPIHKGSRAFGVIIDIGTTTCVVTLCNIFTKKIIDTKAFINPQTKFGHDVISRIAYGSTKSGLKTLHNAIVSIIEENIFHLLNNHSITKEKLYEIVVSGNTTMIHLFLNIDPSPMARAPFTPNIIEKVTLKANSLFSHEYENAVITVLPSFDAFVGSDILSGIYSLDMIQSDENQLLIDLGTNGEIVLGNKFKLLATSTAAGPAFEGINISCGIGAVDGALNEFKMDIENKPFYKTINNFKCIGICGSGLIDIIAELMKANYINKSGYMKSNYDIDDTVFVTPNDVREFQLAKSAIRSGVETLLIEVNIDLNSIKNVFISGGFGQHIDLEHLFSLGILPNEFRNKVKAVGNTSLSGAHKFLFNQTHDDLDKIKAITEVVDLSTNMVFQTKFIEHIKF